MNSLNPIDTHSFFLLFPQTQQITVSQVRGISLD